MASDALRMGDGLVVGLQCGHPNKQPGETCDVCGRVAPAPQVDDFAAEIAKDGNE